MASIGKFNNAFVSMPAELTVAAANLNFDFSLVKVEAPKQYHGVRDALSATRRTEAETGQPHVTARKLGALFESLIPPVPHLLQAYGERVSEISATTKVDTSNYRDFGMFTPHAGLDATSIWAAATSGIGALAVHLLACMLARIWNEPEAISLWVELVERRKHEIMRGVQETNMGIAADVMAAQQHITREQLAHWDSSARAWLQTADSAKRLQQTQLMLIINNVRLPVNSSRDPYESVITAWTSGMSAMEKLIQGIPQHIRNGATLLSISAWHLYPDMVVLANTTKSIDQEDVLLNGGLLTISLQDGEVQDGVHWSLPLSRMRYYSPSVLIERRLASDTSRVSMEEFCVAVLGVFISPWTKICNDTEKLFDLVLHIHHLVGGEDSLHWLRLITGAIRTLRDSTGVMHQQYNKLLRQGIRSGPSFLTSSIPPRFMFGLDNFSSLFALFPDDYATKISFLRSIAATLHTTPETVVIRSRHPSVLMFYANLEHNSHSVPENYDLLRLDTEFDYASALPFRRTGKKRKIDLDPEGIVSHCQWVIGCPRDSLMSCKGTNCRCVSGADSDCICMRTNQYCGDSCHDRDSPCQSQSDPFPMAETQTVGCAGHCAGCFNHLQKCRIEENGDECILIPPERHEVVDEWRFRLKKPSSSDMEMYDFVLGDKYNCGIFKLYDAKVSRYRGDEEGDKARLEEIEFLLHHKALDKKRLCLQLQDWYMDSGLGLALDGIDFAKDLYHQLDGAKINLNVLGLRLDQTAWCKLGIDDLLEKTFACIAMFESGEFDIDPLSLQAVMALSSGDSIFAASSLLSDPTENTIEAPIQRVFGNLGRSEMILLVPPKTPVLRGNDAGAWNVINHEEFNGQFENSFSSTSLHLTFTDFELPLDIGVRGLRDARVVLKESLISLHDSGGHRGDLDILSIFSNPNVDCKKGVCKHKARENIACPAVIAGGLLNPDYHHLTSIDCWEELLDPPVHSKGIVRSTGNWQARLAAAAVSLQMGKKTIVLPQNACSLCLKNVNMESKFPRFEIIVA